MSHPVHSPILTLSAPQGRADRVHPIASGQPEVTPAAWLRRGARSDPWWSRMYSWRKDNG
jgi:hypothetical protein